MLVIHHAKITTIFSKNVQIEQNCIPMKFDGIEVHFPSNMF